MWLGPVALAVTGLTLGVFPELVAGSLVGPATAAILGRSIPIDLSLWYGPTAALWLSIATLVNYNTSLNTAMQLKQLESHEQCGEEDQVE